MKRSFALVLALTLLPCCLGHGRQPNQPPSTPKKSSQKRIRQVPPTHVVVEPPLPPIQIQRAADQAQSQSLEKSPPVYRRAEWVSVAVAVTYAFIALLTLLAIKRQAGAMEQQIVDFRDAGKAEAEHNRATLTVLERQAINLKRQATWMKLSARAARLNAKAAIESAKVAAQNVDVLIVSERAWVLANAIGNPPYLSSEYDPGFTPGIVWRIEVSGRSVARIQREQFRCRLVNVVDGKPELEETPTYTSRSGQFEGESVYAPGFAYQISVVLESGPLTQSSVADIQEGRSMLCAYGRVDYIDIFERKRWTQVCAIYKPSAGGVITSPDGRVLNQPGFRLGGPKGYNDVR